jgi:hypothetical protein
MSPNLPAFVSIPVATSAPATPEKLFTTLSGRASSHGYLRGPQQDILRTYSEGYSEKSDLGLELPTGTGKTGVGLLIGEWKRRKGKRVAFLCLTNQLAGQVLAEAQRLGIVCADLRGTKDTRDTTEEAKYKQGSAIGITTFSNLWNINPVVKEPDVLIFDDAHGGEQFVSSMWTVSVKRHSDPTLFSDLLQALSPAMTEGQVKAIFDDTAPIGVADQADVHHHPECIGLLDQVLRKTEHNARFVWPLLRPHLESCFFLVSAHEIAIRPFISPTHTHTAFSQAKQRIYMSATLGDGSDLLRAYGVSKIDVLKSPNPQFGRRYVFVPGLYRTEADSYVALGALWNELIPKRAVLLSPSERILNDAFGQFANAAAQTPVRLTSSSIADTLTPFTGTTNAVLALANRYDGLDLPDDDCRLLVMAGSPVAVNLMERHLAERWKLTSLFRRRERTRLIQGMGRCTRNATDFSLIFLMGQALADAVTSRAFIDEFPQELAKEITWGLQQSELASQQPSAFLEMAKGLILNSDYRKAADVMIASVDVSQTPPPQLNLYDDSASDEVKFSREMWEGAYEQALETARVVADRVGGPEMAGYRAWWWYLVSIAAEKLNDNGVASGALNRAIGTGINSAWLFRVLRKIHAHAAPVLEGDPRAEELWNAISDWGWTGPAFSQKMAEMRKLLASVIHLDSCMGLEILGRCYGLRSLRPTTQGAPDVAWLDLSRGLALEAKTEKKPTGSLFKKDLQEAKGHPDWLRHFENLGSAYAIQVSILSPTISLDETAKPFAGGLHVVSPDGVRKLGEATIKAVTELRTSFLGREFTESKTEFEQAMMVKGLSWKSIDGVFLSSSL